MSFQGIMIRTAHRRGRSFVKKRRVRLVAVTADGAAGGVDLMNRSTRRIAGVNRSAGSIGRRKSVRGRNMVHRGVRIRRECEYECEEKCHVSLPFSGAANGRYVVNNDQVPPPYSLSEDYASIDSPKFWGKLVTGRVGPYEYLLLFTRLMPAKPTRRPLQLLPVPRRSSRRTRDPKNG